MEFIATGTGLPEHLSDPSRAENLATHHSSAFMDSERDVFIIGEDWHFVNTAAELQAQGAALEHVPLIAFA